MTFKIIISSLLTAISASVYGQNQAADPLPCPKLVVGIMVDQMRWDYLYRYYDRYSEGGFKRMLTEGFTCENTHINYSASVTGIGHASVYTGSVPSVHGIAGNDFIIQATGKGQYCAGDTSVQTVGSSNSSVGKMSPRNMLSTTVTDELRLATNFRSKVIAIASKDRGSILPGGHTANAAYWYDGSSGNWVTSTYYMQQLPDWVTQFNDQKLPAQYLKQDWNTLYPIDTYLQSTADDVRYEGKFAGMTAPTLPVKTSEMVEKEGLGLLTSTPYGSTLTLEFAKAAVEQEQLGDDAITDFLAVSVSTPDYVGHRFGPNAIETEDTYLRLDRDLSTFFDYLDSKVGKGNYTVFLTADHGAINNVNFLRDNKIPAGSFSARRVMKEINSQLEQVYHVEDLIRSFSNNQVSLNNMAIAQHELNEKEIRAKIVAALKEQEALAYVIDIDDVRMAAIPDRLRTQIINGYNRERSGVIQLVFKPGWTGGGATGTTHGTTGPYDTHIPLVFMGWGIQQGKSAVNYDMTDIAPTIAALLRIQEPNGNIGKAINEVLK